MKKIGALVLLMGALLSAFALPFSNFGQLTAPPDLDRVLFAPTLYPTGDWEPSNLKFEDVYFRSTDNTLLHGWYCPSANAQISVLIVHGNAGNVATRTELLRRLQSWRKANVFIFDYRGYGRSEGTPTVHGVLKDAQAAHDKLIQLSSHPADEFVIMGESLGGAIAVDLAARQSPRALILQSTFSNLIDLASIHYPRYVSLVPSDVLNSTRVIREYDGPLWQSHGENDRVIPIELARRLFEEAVGKKQFLAIPTAGHNDWQTPEYYSQLECFLDDLLEASSK